MVKRFDVCMVKKDGLEKPCLVVSPDEINDRFPYVLIAPITLIERQLPFRLTIGIRGKRGQVALDMIHCVPKSDFVRKVGVLPVQVQEELLSQIVKMFSV